MKTLVLLKLLYRRYFTIQGFCKECGRTVHDFVAPDDVWEKVEPHIKHGYILCYDCFCEKCKKLGLPTVWKLQELGERR
ncbi:hypothetical protein KAR91_74045 [Candidatus Pacearchaeota archaeon]|nr:hypothetical protein [Candidatus Pacearchaeota archaeon]